MPRLNVAIIRCQQTEAMCPGNTDFTVAREGKLAFAETGPGIRVIDYIH